MPVIYFGCSVYLKTLEFFCSQKKADVLYFHLITNFTKQSIDNYLKQICKTFPDKLIVMSGPATSQVTITLPNLKLLTSLQLQVDFIQNP